jgi:hypothetical protein
MSWRSLAFAAALLCLSSGTLVAPRLAAAQDGITDWSEPTNVESPENFALEFRFGSYTPDTGDTAFASTFGGSSLLIATEFDVVPFRIADILTLGIGAGIGFVSYSGYAIEPTTGVPTNEKTSLSLVPMNALAVLRVVALPRLLSIPFVFTGKLGLDMTYWTGSTGSTASKDGVSLGLRWAVQAALELDFFEPRAARALDDEWGINHSFLFFEFYGSTSSVGTPRSWSLGLGFNF